MISILGNERRSGRLSDSSLAGKFSLLLRAYARQKKHKNSQRITGLCEAEDSYPSSIKDVYEVAKYLSIE